MPLTLEYAKITGTIAVAVADTVDVGEQPDIVYADSGTVTFTPQIDRVNVPASPTLVSPRAITANITSGGIVSLNGNPEVYLLDLGSALLSPSIPRTQAAYKVDFNNVTAGGQAVTISSFYCNPSAAVSTNDIATMAPVTSSTGAAIVVGPGVPSGGATNQVLAKSSGSDYDTAWVNGGAGGGAALSNVAVKTANYSASANELVPVNPTGGAVTVTLPTSPADKTQIAVKKIDAGGNTVTLACGGSDVFTISGGVTTLTMYYPKQAIVAQYDSTRHVWTVLSDSIPTATIKTFPAMVSWDGTGSQPARPITAPGQPCFYITPGTPTGGGTEAGAGNAVNGLDVLLLTA